MSADGRLDLDDLGEVIDHASDLGTGLDAGANGELLQDAVGPTWAQRLHAAGITPWVRRHPRVVAGLAAAAVLVAGGVVGYPRLVPPPVDPQLRVTISAVLPSQYVIGDAFQSFDGPGIVATGTTLRTAYALTRASDDDTSTYRIVGVVGPTVRASSASPQTLGQRADAPAEEAARADVDVIVDCTDSTSMPIATGSYSLVVTRTDDLGRSLTRALPIPDRISDWPSTLTSLCLQYQALTSLVATDVRSRVDLARRTVTAELDVANALTLPARMHVAPTYGPAAVRADIGPGVLVGVQSAQRLDVRLRVQDCARPELSTVALPSSPVDGNYEPTGRGLYLGADFGRSAVDPSRDPNGGDGRLIAALLLPPPLADRVDDALATVCVGAPEVWLAAAGVGTVRRVASAPPWNDSGLDAVSLPVSVTVTATAGDHVGLSLAELGPDATPTARLTAATARLVDGTARVRTDLVVECGGGYVPPPTIQVDVRRGDRVFPRQIPLQDARLTAALGAACPAIGVQQLVEFGWEDPRTTLGS